MTALLSLDRVSFGYGGQPVLRDITLSVDRDAFTGVVGPSGSGKTSLLKLLLGTASPQHGTLTRAAGLTVSYVPQIETVDWGFPLTVGECVLMARATRRLLPWVTAEEKRDVASVLDRLGIGDLADRHIRALSGGQQQRMFIARALVRRPQLLLMDEPTSGVDVSTRHEVLHLLDELHRDGLAILLTTHDLNGMAAHLPHLVALQHRVVASGPPVDVIVPDVLERTFGARMDVLMHLGFPVVVDTAEAGVA
jgi:zinc/manganese transport system ATP-binding protein